MDDAQNRSEIRHIPFLRLFEHHQTTLHDRRGNHNKRSYKSVEFINAYCIGLKDYFNDQDSKLMYTTVTISAEAIRIGALDSAMLINEWGGMLEEIRNRFEGEMDNLGTSGLF